MVTQYDQRKTGAAVRMRKGPICAVIRPLALILFLTLPASFLVLVGCSAGEGSLITNELNSSETADMGVELSYPQNWQVIADDFFQFKAVGFAPNRLPAYIEYRGLENREFKDDTQMDNHAEGWYRAQPLNYPNWKYESRDKIKTGKGVLYTFEGTYKVGPDTFRKLGRLRFVHNKIHAYYYTAWDRDFHLVRELFSSMDARHIFHEE